MSCRLFHPSPAALYRAKIIAIVVSFLLAGVVILLPEHLFAASIANPTSTPTINSVHVNENVIATGDIVFTGLYDIPYTTPPTNTANLTFIIRLMDPTGVTDLGSTVPFDYSAYENGYDWGVFSLYFPAGNSLTWGSLYIIQITENPAQFTTPLVWNTTIASSAYSSGATDQTDQQTDLATQLSTIGTTLGTDMNETLFALVGSQNELTAQGETYFRGAIESVQAMCPAIFTVQTNTLNLTATAWTTASTWTNYLTQFNGTWVGNAMTATGNQFGMSGNMAMGLIFIAPLCFVFIFLSGRKFNTTDPGLVTSCVILEMGVVMGWVSIALFATLFQSCAIYIAYLWFLARG
jgi:hypothetical protein